MAKVNLSNFMNWMNRVFGRYANFVLYAAIAILLNLVGVSLFKSLRIDLTEGGSFSLSRISKKAVRELAEPLTIRVFFTKNLPPPHSDTERYLRDLLNEYSIAGNNKFNYEFYDCTESKSEG
ncbi:MAG: Gldg family protein, partial [Spirochaetia bacterium]|nr:Gldg family protein [Spirochaetia bacterium]